MKKLTSIIVLSLSVLLISGCGKVVEESELNFRNDTYYPINSDKPYSEKIVSYYENGQLKKSGNYINGKQIGSSEWYKKTELYLNSRLLKMENYLKESSLEKTEL